MDKRLTILQGNSLDVLKGLPDATVQTCVTSPPYWGLRSYLPAGHPLKPFEIGTEKTPEEYVAKLVAVFAQVRRVLRKDGTIWVNLGDSYAASGNGGNPPGSQFQKQATNRGSIEGGHTDKKRTPGPGYKQKDLVGIPWMVAFALRADGWYLRQDIIWSKPNPMPESVTDRCTKAHEYLFLLSKSAKYFYNSEAIKEPSKNPEDDIRRLNQQHSKNKSAPTDIVNVLRPREQKQRGHSRNHDGFNDKWDNMTREEQMACGSNKRSVWTVPPANFREAHFATFPPELILPCIRAGSRLGDTVLDPFGGSGTTGKVALEEGRKAILIELNPDYHPLIQQRCNVTPGLPL